MPEFGKVEVDIDVLADLLDQDIKKCIERWRRGIVELGGANHRIDSFLAVNREATKEAEFAPGWKSGSGSPSEAKRCPIVPSFPASNESNALQQEWVSFSGPTAAARDSQVVSSRRTSIATETTDVAGQVDKSDKADVRWNASVSFQPSTAPLSSKQVALQHFMERPLVTLMSGALIVANILILCFEIDHYANFGDTPTSYAALNVTFTFLFLIELLLRIVAAGPLTYFFQTPECTWNVFDAILVAIALVEVIASVKMRGYAALRLFRVIRMMRIARVTRVLKMVSYVNEIRRIFVLLSSSFSTLAWSLLAVTLVMLLFAVILTQKTAEMHWGKKESNVSLTAMEDVLVAEFGTITRSMYSLFCSILNGRDWGELVDPLMELGVFYAGIFLVFISFSLFGVMNIIASVFVDCATRSTQLQRDWMVEEKKHFELKLMRHMQKIFKEIDVNGSGTIEYEELQSCLQQNPQLQDYFKALELNATDTLTLFELLDQDGEGSLTIDAFVHGAMRLKGEARAFDISFLIQECQKTSRSLGKLERTHRHDMERLRKTIAALGDKASNTANTDLREPLACAAPEVPIERQSL